MTYEDICRMEKQLQSEKIREEYELQHNGNKCVHHGCDCGDNDILSEEIDKIIESNNVEADVFKGCGPLREADEVESTLQAWIEKLKRAGYYDEDATQAVFDALADLVERNVVSDCPDADAPKHKKDEWIRQFNSRVYAKLTQMGIDFEGEHGEIHGENGDSLDT